MTRHDIGVDLADLRLPPKDAIRRAADLGMRSVEVPTVSGDLAARSLSASGRRHLAGFVRGLGMHLAALRADLPRLNLTDPKAADQRVERTGEIIDLARDLHVSIVTASVGALTHPDTAEPSGLALDGLRRIGEWADARGIHFALRPSRDGGDRLATVLHALACPSIGIGLDPAGMLIHAANPLQSIDRYIDQVRLVHVRDAVSGGPDGPGREVPLGEGDADLPAILAVLSAGDYAGPYILRRVDAADPVAAFRRAKELLAGWLSAA